MAANLLASAGGTVRQLARLPPSYLGSVHCVGRAKAARIAAALELARRLDREHRGLGEDIRSPSDVHRRYGPMLRDLVVEEFHLLTLDAQNRVTRQPLITRGILHSSLIHPREVFRAAIAVAGAGFIFVNTLPSVNTSPSAYAKSVSTHVVDACKLLDMPVYDHVIVAGDHYFTFAEAGLL